MVLMANKDYLHSHSHSHSRSRFCFLPIPILAESDDAAYVVLQNEILSSYDELTFQYTHNPPATLLEHQADTRGFFVCVSWAGMRFVQWIGWTAQLPFVGVHNKVVYLTRLETRYIVWPCV